MSRVVVLGMHRSGTSAAARVVNLLGIPLVDGDLMEADEANPRGYWESRPLSAANDAILAALGRSWTFPPRVGVEWDAAVLEAARARARASFGRLFSRPSWVWKDPRACVTLPFWRSTLGLEPAVVLVWRNPLEVAGSLAGRDGLSTRRSLALWERYVRHSLASAEGLRAHVSSYEELVADPAGWAETVAAFLGVTVGDRTEVARFVDPALRRARSQPEALAEVSPGQAVLLGVLKSLSGAHESFRAPELGPETDWVEDVLATSEVADARRHADALERTLDEVLASRSYRWTAPARRVAGRLLRVARA